MADREMRLRYDEQTIRHITFPEVEKTLYVPEKLKRALMEAGVEVAREFIPLIRQQDARTTDVIIRRLERRLNIEQRRKLALGLPVMFRRNNPSLKAVWERWAPPEPKRVRPPSAKARGNGDLWISWPQARKHGMTRPEAMDLLHAQDFRCAICSTPFSGRSDLCMDHNHATGKFRAFLCVACNTGLGFFADCPARLRSALAYLAEHGYYGPGALEKPSERVTSENA